LSSSPLRVLIVDDHELFRASLASLLRLRADIEEVTELGTLAELEARIAEIRPDILLLDLQLERSAIPDIPRFTEVAKVIVVTASERVDDVLAAVRAGARGAVLKSSPVETLLEAIRAVADGHVLLPPWLQARLVGELRHPSDDLLTTREREIVCLVARGLRNHEVAARLFISIVTVKSHLSHVFQKLGVRDRADLVLYAVRAGLIDVHEPKL
jgi:DNA-binding NarL/FixJ family response regulator